MNRFTMRLLITLLTFLVGVGAVASWLFLRASAPEDTVHPLGAPHERHAVAAIPSMRADSLFYPYVDKQESRIPLQPLRRMTLPAGDLEVRVWKIVSFKPPQGFVLKRMAGRWSASHLESDSYDEPKEVKRTELMPPVAGWEACWQELLEAGLVTLPDSEGIEYDAGGLDGWGYGVEVREGSVYRSYGYANPDDSRTPEAGRMLEISNIIRREFNLPTFTAERVSAR